MGFHDKRRREAYNANHRVKERARRLRHRAEADKLREYGIRAPSGRVTKLDKKCYESICSLLAEGNTLECAATLSGVDSRTLWTWVRDGQANPEGPFGQFASDVAYAKEVSHRYLVHKIATDEDWKAAAFLLKNKFPALYREHVSTEISGPNGTPVPMSMQTFSVVLELHPDEQRPKENNDEPEPQFRIEGNGSTASSPVHATEGIRSGPAGTP